jgi:hypothetical protein
MTSSGIEYHRPSAKIGQVKPMSGLTSQFPVDQLLKRISGAARNDCAWAKVVVRNVRTNSRMCRDQRCWNFGRAGRTTQVTSPGRSIGRAGR